MRPCLRKTVRISGHRRKNAPNIERFPLTLLKSRQTKRAQKMLKDI
jgi:hypothetical protein